MEPYNWAKTHYVLHIASQICYSQLLQLRQKKTWPFFLFASVRPGLYLLPWWMDSNTETRSIIWQGAWLRDQGLLRAIKIEMTQNHVSTTIASSLGKQRWRKMIEFHCIDRLETNLTLTWKVKVVDNESGTTGVPFLSLCVWKKKKHMTLIWIDPYIDPLSRSHFKLCRFRSEKLNLSWQPWTVTGHPTSLPSSILVEWLKWFLSFSEWHKTLVHPRKRLHCSHLHKDQTPKAEQRLDSKISFSLSQKWTVSKPIHTASTYAHCSGLPPIRRCFVHV